MRRSNLHLHVRLTRFATIEFVHPFDDGFDINIRGVAFCEHWKLDGEQGK